MNIFDMDFEVKIETLPNLNKNIKNLLPMMAQMFNIILIILIIFIL